MITEHVPFFEPSITGHELEGAARVLRSGQLGSATRAASFEESFASFVGSAHAVAVTSGRAALRLALRAAGVGPGDEVVVPSWTTAVTPEVIFSLGATPVLVDVDSDSLAMSPRSTEQAISNRTRAIVPVHHGGAPIDLDPFEAICSSNSHVRLIDDAAHAFPASTSRGPVGSLTDGTCFSFGPNKTLTTGEGGMFTTNDAALAARVRELSRHGISSRNASTHAWEHDILEPGWNANMTELSAAIGLAQLDRAAALADRRRRICSLYDEAFSDSRTIVPVAASTRESSACHRYDVRIRGRVARDEVRQQLAAHNIECRVGPEPLHKRSWPGGTVVLGSNKFAVADAAFAEILSLPVFPAMAETQVQRVIDILLAVVSGWTLDAERASWSI